MADRRKLVLQDPLFSQAAMCPALCVLQQHTEATILAPVFLYKPNEYMYLKVFFFHLHCLTDEISHAGIIDKVTFCAT